MKKLITVLSINILVIFIACSSEVTITRIMINGQSFTERYSENLQQLVIFDSAKNRYKTKTIEGLEKFKNLKVLEFQNLKFLENYNFLINVSSCEKLYISTGPYFDFHILKNMKHLKILEFYGNITESDIAYIKINGIDLSFLPDLESFVFDPFNIKLDFTPKILYAEKKS